MTSVVDFISLVFCSFKEEFGKFAPSRDFLMHSLLVRSCYRSFSHLLEFLLYRVYTVFETPDGVSIEDAHINVIWEDFSVSISYGWRRGWVMVDDVYWWGNRMDLADWWRRVLLHNRQWVVVARSS